MPECYADTLLIECLLPTKTGYNHKNSCFKVEAEMKNGKLKDRFAVGIIDNDKKQIKYLVEFEEIGKVENSLILWKHNEKHHYIIQLCPALEKWVLNVCGKAAIEHKLGFEQLRMRTKSASSFEDTALKDLFLQLTKRNDLLEIRKLGGWLKLLKEKNYEVDINELKNV